jgi:hypothetical protein
MSDMLVVTFIILSIIPNPQETSIMDWPAVIVISIYIFWFCVVLAWQIARCAECADKDDTPFVRFFFALFWWLTIPTFLLIVIFRSMGSYKVTKVSETAKKTDWSE